MRLDKLNEVLSIYNKSAVAEKMGISRSLLCHKLKGTTKISLAEASMLISILRLSDEEARNIFFDEK